MRGKSTGCQRTFLDQEAAASLQMSLHQPMVYGEVGGEIAESINQLVNEAVSDLVP
jgi:hypothetical protein